jgi:hypothetical protein
MSNTTFIYLGVGFAVAAGLLIILTLLVPADTNPITAFFNENIFSHKPPKPEFNINPLLTQELDKLYDAYPNIHQGVVDDVHTSGSAVCFSGAMSNVNDPETRDNVFGQMAGMAMCRGVVAGSIENYLDALGVSYYSNEGGLPPTVFKDAKK